MSKKLKSNRCFHSLELGPMRSEVSRGVVKARVCPCDVPSKPGGSTPTMVSWVAPMRKLLPMAAGAPMDHPLFPVLWNAAVAAR